MQVAIIVIRTRVVVAQTSIHPDPFNNCSAPELSRTATTGEKQQRVWAVGIKSNEGNLKPPKPSPKATNGKKNHKKKKKKMHVVMKVIHVMRL